MNISCKISVDESGSIKLTGIKPAKSLTQINALKTAKKIFELLGADPQRAFTLLQIAKSVDNDPQKVLAITAIARFLTKRD